MLHKRFNLKKTLAWGIVGLFVLFLLVLLGLAVYNFPSVFIILGSLGVITFAVPWALMR